MTTAYPGAKGAQTLSGRVVRKVRAAYLEPQIEQHFGNPAHAGTADAYEVDA
jgi:hypothetical protein